MGGEILTIGELASYLKIAEKTTYRLVLEKNSRVLRLAGLGVFVNQKLVREKSLIYVLIFILPRFLILGFLIFFGMLLMV